MKTYEIELALRRWFEQELQLPSKYANRVQVHWRGQPYLDNQLLVIQPRMRSFQRSGPRDSPHRENLTFEVTIWIKQEPNMDGFGLLSLLVDEVRRLVDSTRRDADGGPGAVTKVYNRDGVEFACMDFGPAQERRAEGQTVQTGGATLSGVDLAVLTSNVLVTPLKPRVNARR